jgi:hypothetical protein
MVHALERAANRLAPGGVIVCIQPHRMKRPFISVIAQRRRTPIGFLINPVFQPLINSAEAAIAEVLDRNLATLIGREDHRFRIQLANPNQLRRFLDSENRPPRFAPGDRKRLLHVWSSMPQGASIEVSEFLTVIALRKRGGSPPPQKYSSSPISLCTR